MATQHKPKVLASTSRTSSNDRLFKGIDFEARDSHFDRWHSSTRNIQTYEGFFVLFWVGLTIMIMTTAMHNLKETGKIFGGSLFSLLSDKLLELAVGDGIMVISAGFVVLVQNIVQKGYISWDKTGYILQHFLQLVWLGWWLSWIFMHSWGWTHNVTFVLHTIVLLMKLHSYSFYNGHLSAAESRLRMLYAKVSDAKDASKEDLEEIEILDRELSSPIGELRYPENLSIARWIDYLIVPSLVYALDWPRTERIRWFYVLEKSLATLGSIFLLYIVAEHYMVPVMHTAAQSLVRQENISGILMTVAEGITWLLFPFTLAILLVFYIVFESILNVFAEISRFADRRFYDDWWNSHTWAAFAVKWNRPVHSFLRVHVYNACQPKFSQSTATFLTFLISSIFHELVLVVIFRKLRFYGFIAQMFQIPLIQLQRIKLLRDHKTTGNAVFWIGLILGLSSICSLYVLF